MIVFFPLRVLPVDINIINVFSNLSGIRTISSPDPVLPLAQLIPSCDYKRMRIKKWGDTLSPRVQEDYGFYCRLTMPVCSTE